MTFHLDAQKADLSHVRKGSRALIGSNWYTVTGIEQGVYMFRSSTQSASIPEDFVKQLVARDTAFLEPGGELVE